MFLEFNSGHFGIKKESLRPSCKKIDFDHIWANAKNDLLQGFQLGTFFGDSRELMQYFRVRDTP